MKGWYQLTALGVAVFVWIGGCPQSVQSGPRIPATTAGDTGTSGSSSGGSSVQTSGGGLFTTTGSGTPSEVADTLTLRFPGCSEPASGRAWRDQVLQLVNQERTSRGLGRVTRNTTLEDQATQYACEMITYDFFAHDNPVTGSDLADRADEFGYDYWTIGENLAAGQSTPAAVVEDWMDSPDHRANILNPAFTELGVGVRVGGQYGYYWVQEFGRPQSAGIFREP